ncbi:hypothetical protein D1Y84_09335 [Acidipila sp. EB88]|nr:hypothetical protein D1Y84_09335 [Acidipila sp. EB88]
MQNSHRANETQTSIADIRSNKLALEQHYTPKEIAEVWNLNEKTVRSLFADEANVVRIVRQETRGKRGYCSLRIPKSVVMSVHKRLTCGR